MSYKKPIIYNDNISDEKLELMRKQAELNQLEALKNKKTKVRRGKTVNNNTQLENSNNIDFADI